MNNNTYKIPYYILTVYIFLCFTSPKIYSQKKYSPIHTPLSIEFNFGVQLPAADMSKRFGTNLSVGVGFEKVFVPKGWILGVQGQYIFGQNVKEDVLVKMRTTESEILSDIGTYASVFLRERGYYIGGYSGKLFKLRDDGNRFKGIRITLGIGFLQHKIRLQDDSQSAPQIAPPYDVGYDRLTYGFALNQFIGYQIVSRDKMLNFYIGLEITEGFTKNRRGFNYDTRLFAHTSRLDILYGLKLGWSIVLFTNQKADDIEY